jgi:hypothetical protein
VSVPIGVIIRFAGDPDDTLARFEAARAQWIEEQAEDYERPLFYATARARDGIVILTAWRTAVAHRAFGEGIGPHIAAQGLARPEIEHLRIEGLGWD